MSTSLLYFFTALIVFLFIYWRRLNQDYEQNQIFSSGLIIIISLLLGASTANFIIIPSTTGIPANPSGIVFWSGVSGLVFGFLISIQRFKLKLFEAFESVSIASLYLLLIIFLADALKNSSWSSLVASAIFVALISIFYFLESRYKKFTWYRSGKIGFSGLTSLGIMFLLRGILAIPFPFVLSFLGKVEGLVSSVTAFVLFLALFNLARQKV